jgi:hypothetical protein
MKLNTYFFALLLGCACATHALAEPEAAGVMKSVKDRYRGETWITNSTVVLIDKDNNRSARKVKTINKKTGANLRSKTLLVEPARIAGTSFLSYDWTDPNKDDEAWIYLPELAKVSRMATGSRADYFLGSDYSYGDLEDIKLEYYDFTMVADDKTPKDQWLIQATPRQDIQQKVVDRTGYQKIWFWVDKEKTMVVKAKYWLRDAGWNKFRTLSDIQKIDGVWVAKKEQMVLTQQGTVVHATTVTNDDDKINPSVDEAQFAPQSLGSSIAP